MKSVDIVLVLVLVATFVILVCRPVRNNRNWSATITPLASIIGSGFLVSVPLLAGAIGIWAVAAIAGLAVLSFLLGGAIRYNIRYGEPVIESTRARHTIRSIEGLSHLVLAGAYFIAVAYYLMLLAAFGMKLLGWHDPVLGKIAATVLISGICGVGALKGTGVPAEPVEGRASAKGNPRSESTRRTQSRESVTQAAGRIRQAATRKPQEKLTALLHHVTPDALRWAFHALKRDAAAGVDGMTWALYAEGLEERLLDLHRRVQSGAYRALPVRRVEILKPDGGIRPLGVAALEDKIVQKAVTEIILTPLYEPVFLGFNYGFRPGRRAHDALDALAVAIDRRKVNWVVDCDIRKFFDSVSRAAAAWRLRPSRPPATGRSVSGKPCARSTGRRASSAVGCTRPPTC